MSQKTTVHTPRARMSHRLICLGVPSRCALAFRPPYATRTARGDMRDWIAQDRVPVPRESCA